MQQQAGLPALLTPASPMASMFADSTHQLWRCDTADGAMILKVCNQHTVQHSPFWQAMNSLFKLNFPHSLNHIEKTHQLVECHGSLAVPDYIAAEASSFVLVRELEGDDVSVADVSTSMVTQLAQHLAQLHQYTFERWGSIDSAQLSAQQWPERLRETLQVLIDAYPDTIAESIINKALAQVDELKNDSFAPVMVDLRWDQMLQQQGQLSAVVDMDAFVIAPPALELVLLEYQLTPQQAECFAKQYQRLIPFPDLSSQRECYRLLLFLMNSLGETDVEKWMNAPVNFPSA